MEKPLFWHQGLFLQPQHLQLMDRNHQSGLTPYHKYLQPHLTGVAKLKIRENSLPGFSFHIDHGAFWFEDMAYAVLSENAVIEPRLIKDSWVDGGRPLIVYVGLKKYSDYGENVTIVSAGENLSKINTRFVTQSNPDQVCDLHQNGAPAQVKRLSFLLKIFFHSEMENLGDYELIPVASLERKGDDIRVSGEFIPPCVTISASPVLAGLVKEVRDQLSFRGNELELHKKKRGIHNAEFGSRDMVYLLALRSFNRYIPLFTHMFEGQNIHPRDIYSVLRQLIGELSSFSDKINVLGEGEDETGFLPAYDHNDLWQCFSCASDIVARLLDEITAGPEYVLSLDYEEPYYWKALKPEHFEGNNHFYLVIRTEEDIKTILDAIEIGVKISSRKILPMLIERALPGALLEYIPAPPQELPRRSDSVYFRLDNLGEQWGTIEKEKNLAVYWDSSPEDMNMEMMIVRRK